MRKWMIRLEGDESHLDIAAKALSRLESHRIERDGDAFYLSSSAVALSTADDVREHARRVSAIIRGLAKLYAPGTGDWKCTDYVVMVDEAGRRIASMPVGSEVTALWGVEGADAHDRYAAAITAATRRGGNVELAALLLDRDLTWAELYKLYEVIKKDVGRIPSSWASPADLKAFTASANHPAVSGLDARHGVLSGPPPKMSGRMDLHSARNLVLRIAGHWLDKLAD